MHTLYTGCIQQIKQWEVIHRLHDVFYNLLFLLTGGASLLSSSTN